MLKSFCIAVVFFVLVTGCATTQPGHEIRIDASSPEAAEASFSAMMKERSDTGRQELAIAVIMLNMKGVESAYEVMIDPELQSPSISRIRNKVAGLSAEEIIDLAERNPSVSIEVLNQ